MGSLDEMRKEISERLDRLEDRVYDAQKVRDQQTNVILEKITNLEKQFISLEDRVNHAQTGRDRMWMIVSPGIASLVTYALMKIFNAG